MWRLAPFYLAVAAAPLLFGGVKPESQAILGILLALGLIFTHAERHAKEPLLPGWLKMALLILVLLPLIPLPIGLVKLLSPERARLAAEFPIGGAPPAWITLSISPARTVHRLWELALAAAAFILARHSSSRPGGSRHLALTLAIALALLGLSDVWSRQHGRESVLGLWSISWGKGAGTFANRNHFANWIYVAALFCGGWLLREIFRAQRKASVTEIIFVAGAILFALALAILSASRGGAAAFIVGIAGAVWLARARLRRKNFGLAASFLIIGLVAVALLFGEQLINRLRTEQSAGYLAYKRSIWAQTARLYPKFPILGAGAGSFVRAFNLYKTTDGDSTFLHAENDYVEFPLEYGIPATALAVIALILLLRKGFLIQRETPLLAGLAGGALVFATHALSEFVSFVPANLLLMAVLLGFAAGRAAPKIESARSNLPALAASAVFLLLACLQLAAWFEFRKSTPQGVERSLALWPLAVERQIPLLRLESKGKPDLNAADTRANRALRLDPLNWELRLEQAWFDLAFSTNQSHALSNAWLTLRLNPLQGQIPLRFARHFAARDPDTALAFLAAVHPDVPAYHEAALALVWDITRDPAQLWKLTHNTVPGLLSLAHVAQKQKLPFLAAEAAQALEGRVDPILLARIYLEAHRPAEAIRILGASETFAALKLRALALHELSRPVEAVAVAQQLFALENTLQTGFPADASHAQLLEQHKAHPADPAAGLLLAEKTAVMQPIDLALLADLARQFPNEPRIAYLLFRTQLASRQTNAASQTAAALIPRLPDQ